MFSADVPDKSTFQWKTLAQEEHVYQNELLILLKSDNTAALTIEFLWTPGNVSIAKNKLYNF